MISAPYWSTTLATAIWIAEGCKVSQGAPSCAATVIGEINAIKRKKRVTRVVIMSLTFKGVGAAPSHYAFARKLGGHSSQTPDFHFEFLLIVNQTRPNTRQSANAKFT